MFLIKPMTKLKPVGGQRGYVQQEHVSEPFREFLHVKIPALVGSVGGSRRAALAPHLVEASHDTLVNSHGGHKIPSRIAAEQKSWSYYGSGPVRSALSWVQRRQLWLEGRHEWGFRRSWRCNPGSRPPDSAGSSQRKLTQQQDWLLPCSARCL